MHWRSLLAWSAVVKPVRAVVVLLATGCPLVCSAVPENHSPIPQQHKKLAQEPRIVKDLRYGVALYEFFQQSYFDALTEIMIGQQQNELLHHPKQAELLRGGMSLSYGMVDEAKAVFTRLLESSDQHDQQKNQAWFYLAKLQYQFEQADHARASLSRAGELAENVLVEERHYMMANLALKAGDFSAAQQSAQQLEPNSIWLPYYFFNRGIALTRQGDWQQGVLAFQQLTDVPAKTEEVKNLKDRAYTAAGYAYLAGKQYELAQQQFRQVRRGSLFVQRALLGYGWAAAQQQQYKAALSPWQTLREYSLMEASVQESLLAVPFAYEKLDALGSALVEYKQSVELLDGELQRIDQAVALYTRSGIKHIFELDTPSAVPVQDWFSNQDLMPNDEHAPYLSYLITRQRFQDRIAQLSELYRLQQFLDRAKKRVELAHITVEERQRLWQEKVDGSREEMFLQQYQQVLKQKQNIEQTIQQAEQVPDGILLMDDKERKLWGRIQRATDVAEQLAKNGRNIEKEKNKLFLFKGLLLWQFNEQYPERIWQVRKQQQELALLLKTTEPGLERIKSISSEPVDQGFNERIAKIEGRLQGQHKTVALQIDKLEQIVRSLAIEELEQQRQRLSRYKGQAKLAIARLHDLGNPDFSGTDKKPDEVQPSVEEAL